MDLKNHFYKVLFLRKSPGEVSALVLNEPVQQEQVARWSWSPAYSLHLILSVSGMR